MELFRIAAFADGEEGGNPAGVVLLGSFPSDEEMQRIAAEIGYSETVFACPGSNEWRVRYFSPEVEVAFCGHATIALGAAICARHGDGSYDLELQGGRTQVACRRSPAGLEASLTSLPPRDEPVPAALLEEALALFEFQATMLDSRLPPALAQAGVPHLILPLENRDQLASMRYDFGRGQQFMHRAGLVTICLLYIEHSRRFHARNAFAIGGVYEDPATGAAAAALGGYLRSLRWPHDGQVEVIQGEDMGMRSRLTVDISDVPGAPVRVSGLVRFL